jgi:hypothetical protein
MARALFIVAVILSAFFTGPAPIWSQAIDAQSLIGSWEGTWQWRTGEQQAGGQYYLTIDRVQGNKVFGSVLVNGRGTREYKIVGTLEGTRLTYGGELRTDLQVVDNSRMEGTSTGRFNRAITLTKRQ